MRRFFFRNSTVCARRTCVGTLWAGSLLVVTLLFTGTCALADSPWTVVDDDDGVEVSVQDRGEGKLPVFRGKGMIHAPLLEIVAVLHDPGRRPEWLPLCMEARLLREVNPLEYILYERVDAPWPVNDRDIVLRSQVKLNPTDQSVRIVFESDPSFRVPPHKGVTRMQFLKGFFLLRSQGEEKTHVTYQLDAHPGGSLPDWMVEFASEDTPRENIVALREQVQTTWKKRIYEELVQEWGVRMQVPVEVPPSRPAPSEGAPPSP